MKILNGVLNEELDRLNKLKRTMKNKLQNFLKEALSKKYQREYILLP